MITKDNILASFRGAGLVPNDPERVLSKLDVVLRTPTPPQPEATPWESKTPSSLLEIEAQSTLVRERIRQHGESSISPLLQAVDSLAKGIAIIAHNSVLQTGEIAGLHEAMDAMLKQYGLKRNYIRAEESLKVGEVLDLMAEKEGDSEKAAEQPAKRVRAHSPTVVMDDCAQATTLICRVYKLISIKPGTQALFSPRLITFCVIKSYSLHSKCTLSYTVCAPLSNQALTRSVLLKS